MTVLKKCPFCGSENIEAVEAAAEPGRLSWVKCKGCYAMIKRGGGELDKAISAWNNRAADVHKSFAELTPEEFDKTIAGLSGLVPLIAPLITQGNFEGKGIEDTAEFTVDLYIAVDAVEELKRQIYGATAGRKAGALA